MTPSPPPSPPPPSSPPKYQPLQLSSKKKQKYEPLQHPLTQATMHTFFNRRTKKGVLKRWDIVRHPGINIYFGDCKSRKYEWLEPGWIVQERHMPGGRIYQNYYDPSGFRYGKKHKVLDAFADMRREFGSAPGDVVPGKEHTDESEPNLVSGRKRAKRRARGQVTDPERGAESSMAGLHRSSGLGLLARLARLAIEGPVSGLLENDSEMRVESAVADPAHSKESMGSDMDVDFNPNLALVLYRKRS